MGLKFALQQIDQVFFGQPKRAIGFAILGRGCAISHDDHPILTTVEHEAACKVLVSNSLRKRAAISSSAKAALLLFRGQSSGGVMALQSRRGVTRKAKGRNQAAAAFSDLRKDQPLSATRALRLAMRRRRRAFRRMKPSASFWS